MMKTTGTVVLLMLGLWACDIAPPVIDGGPEPDGGVVDPCPEQIFEGSMTVTNSEQLSAMRGITRIQGALSIAGDDITELAPLECLKSVTTGFNLGPAPNLTSLKGLERFVGPGSLGISETAITSLTGLESVSQLESLNLTALPELETLDGLNPEHSLSKLLVLRFLPKLVDASSLGPYEVVYLELLSLNNLELVPTVRIVNGPSDRAIVTGLQVNSLDRLRSLEGLRMAPEVRGKVKLERLPLLSDLAALSGVTSIRSGATTDANILSLQHLPALTGLSSLSSLQHVDGFTLLNLDGIENLDDLSALEQVTGRIYIRGNSSLTSIGQLAGVTIDGESIEIGSNELLRRCEVDALVEGWRANGFAGEVTINGLALCE
jgi:hypothetical protein